MKKDALPLGLAMALAQRPDAMDAFAAMTPSQKDEVLHRARAVSSKSEMQSVVEGLSSPR